MKLSIIILGYIILILIVIAVPLFVGKTKMEGWHIVSIERPVTAVLVFLALIAAILNK